MAQAAFDYPNFDTLLLTSIGRLYLSAWDSDWIMEIDRERGGAIRRFRLEHEPMTIPDHQIEGMREILGNDIAGGLAWLQERIWFLTMQEGPQGEIWVNRRGEPLDDGTWPVDVFTADGEYRGRMQHGFFFPPGSTWRDPELFTIGAAEEDAPALVRLTFHPNP